MPQSRFCHASSAASQTQPAPGSPRIPRMPRATSGSTPCWSRRDAFRVIFQRHSRQTRSRPQAACRFCEKASIWSRIRCATAPSSSATARTAVGGFGELRRGIEHPVAKRPEFHDVPLARRSEGRDIRGDLFLALFTRRGVLAHRAIELLVVARGGLEHPDRAQQRADLVVARGIGHVHRIAPGYLFGHARDRGERPDDGAMQDQRADRLQQNHDGSQHGHQPGCEVVPESSCE